MKRTWFYLLNTFLINTRKAPAKMLRIGNDHDSRLSAEVSDPEIEALWNFLHPILVAFQTLFSAWKASISYRMSMTLALTKLFKQLGDEWIKAWEGKVYNSFPEGTPEAMAIFPNKRKPFQSGTYEERIIAVNTLAESLAPYADLAALKLDVEAKYTALTKARNIQKQAMASEGKNASDLENQRIEVGDVLYKDLGSLMAKFYKKPTDVERFFNLSLIRRSSSESDGTFSQDGMVGAGASLVVSIPKKFELSISATFIFANSEGGSELHFFFADSAATTDSPNKGVVAPGESLEITAGEMGWSATNTIFIVKNAGGVTAEYELTATE
jgi:hypothetical protein